MCFCGVDLRVAEGRGLGFEVVGVNLGEGGRGAGARDGWRRGRGFRLGMLENAGLLPRSNGHLWGEPKDREP